MLCEHTVFAGERDNIGYRCKARKRYERKHGVIAAESVHDLQRYACAAKSGVWVCVVRPRVSYNRFALRNVALAAVMVGNNDVHAEPVA